MLKEDAAGTAPAGRSADLQEVFAHVSSSAGQTGRLTPSPLLSAMPPAGGAAVVPAPTGTLSAPVLPGKGGSLPVNKEVLPCPTVIPAAQAGDRPAAFQQVSQKPDLPHPAVIEADAAQAEDRHAVFQKVLKKVAFMAAEQSL